MDKVLTHIVYYDRKKKEINSWDISSKEKGNLFDFIEAYETGKITRRTATNPKTLIERTLYYLKFCLESLKKDNPQKEDIEKFFDNLLKDKLKSFNKKTKKYNGNPYSFKTKKEIISAFIKYLKWKFPDKPLLLEPLKIEMKEKAREPQSLSLSEIDALYKGCRNEEERYFIAVLFSSGARAEEFHNIRHSDIILPKGNENYVKLRIRAEFSKTEGRTISLYYKHSLEAVREFLEQRIKQGMKPEEPIFQKSYSRQKDWLNALGKRVLSRNLNYHIFRHSSATWLASKLNRQQLCIYYGWKFSSPMPDIYIKRAGVGMDEVSKKFETTDIEELRLKNERLEAQLKDISLKLNEYEGEGWIEEKIKTMLSEKQLIELGKKARN